MQILLITDSSYKTKGLLHPPQTYLHCTGKCDAYMYTHSPKRLNTS